jgi:GNAT superfamily N-acetyltransferase
MITVRPMGADHVLCAEEAWHDAYSTMRAQRHLPPELRSEESAQRMRMRIAHLLSSDPEGSWVAIDNDTADVVGLSQALVREDLWVLSLLGVASRCQDRGTGKALLDAAIGYGSESSYGLILCSRDPRAARRYKKAGFDLHPSVTARGEVDRSKLGRGARVRDGSEADLAFISDLDRHLRGGPHGPDLQFALDTGARVLVVRDGGYAVARGSRLLFLAAKQTEAAIDLLTSVLAVSEPGEAVEVNWMTAGQQWAIGLAVELGLELEVGGPVMTRGLDGTPTTYLPSGAYG